MAKMIRDKPGQLALRPFFELSELDHACEFLIHEPL